MFDWIVRRQVESAEAEKGAPAPVGVAAELHQKQREAAIGSTLRRRHLPGDPGHDILQGVLKKGVLRIGCDPAFVGLSFRLRPGDALRGLDIADDSESPWLGRIELLPKPLTDRPGTFVAGVRGGGSGAALLARIYKFIEWFDTQPERHRIERKYQDHRAIA